MKFKLNRRTDTSKNTTRDDFFCNST